VEAPTPPQAVEKSFAGEGLLAHVVVSKYVDHLPLHRLEGIFAREGIDLARTILCGLVADVASALTPIGVQLRREITAAAYLQTDDTSVTVLDDRGGSFKGRLWRISIPWGGRSSSMRRPRTNGTGPSSSSPTFRARSKRTRTPGMTSFTRAGVCERWAVGRTRGGGLSRR